MGVRIEALDVWVLEGTDSSLSNSVGLLLEE